jgi:hypothetical protein
MSMPVLRKREYFWPFAWGGTAVVLAVVLTAEYKFGQVDVGTGQRAPAKIADAKLLPPFALAPEAQVAPETLARPLFVPARRPSPAAATAGVPVMRKGQFVLTGVTVTPEASFAFLKEVASGKTQSVKKGSQVNGIMIDVVEPRRVVLRQGDETEDLALVIQVPARVASAAPNPAPGAPGAVPPAPGSAPAPVPVAPPGAGSFAPPMPPPAAGAVPPVLGAVPATPGNPALAGAAPKESSTAGEMPAAAQPTTRRRPWMNAQ